MGKLLHDLCRYLKQLLIKKFVRKFILEDTFANVIYNERSLMLTFLQRLTKKQDAVQIIYETYPKLIDESKHTHII